MNPTGNTGACHHHRHSIRLRGYDYGQAGAYFVTVCAQEQVCLFGEVMDGEMRLNECGRVIEQCWLGIPNHFPHVALDAFVIMPNHLHGIIVITGTVGANGGANNGANAGANVGANNYSPLRYAPGTTKFKSPSKTIGSIVRGFKIGVTKWFRQHTNIFHVWQRNYYEHVVRDDGSLDRIRQYIAMNPLQWVLDRENPEGKPVAAVESWEV